MFYIFFNNLSNEIIWLTKNNTFAQNVLLLDEGSCQMSKPIVRSQAVAIANGTFVCESMKLQTDASTDSKKKLISVMRIIIISTKVWNNRLHFD